MDTVSPKMRSRTMRAVKSKGNQSTEIALIGLFKNHGIKGWRRNSSLFGKPDFYFPKLRMVVFADGCFWHGCSCRKQFPSTNVEYWKRKISRNRTRDRIVNRELCRRGFTVIRVKECQIRKGKLPSQILQVFHKSQPRAVTQTQQS